MVEEWKYYGLESKEAWDNLSDEEKKSYRQLGQDNGEDSAEDQQGGAVDEKEV